LIGRLPKPPAPPTGLQGYLVEFETVDALLRAARIVREAGYTHWDSYTPCPVHGIDEAMGIRETKLPFFVLGGGVAGASLAFLMQWWMNAVNYPYVVSGKPFLGLPANIPIIFELTVLLSAFGAFFGMLIFNRLPELHHSVFSSPRFRRATTDRFYIAIEARDPAFDEEETRRFMAGLGGSEPEALREGGEAQ